LRGHRHTAWPIATLRGGSPHGANPLTLPHDSAPLLCAAAAKRPIGPGAAQNPRPPNPGRNPLTVIGFEFDRAGKCALARALL